MHAANPTSPLSAFQPISGPLVLATLFPDEEIWAPIPDFPGYEVSSKARMRSYWRFVNVGGKGGSIRFLEPYPQRVMNDDRVNKSSYIRFLLRNREKRETQQVGHWMLRAFVGPWPGDGWDCCHRNGDHTNNDLANLRWDTTRANCIDTVIMGTNNRAHLRPSDVLTIKHRLKSGESYSSISRDFDVHRSTIYKIDIGVSWSHIG